MKYMGSKARHAKELLPLILKNRFEDQYYVEPFVDGANIIENVNGKRIGSDSNFYLIELLKKMQQGIEWCPQHVTESQYKEARTNPEKYPAWSIGYCGFCLSYGGKWFGGWRRDKDGKRNYVIEAYRNTIKQAPKLKGIEFKHCNYNQLTIPSNSIIYCDPPYENTTGYKDKFCHSEFWQWCREQHYNGHEIFVSEYSAPSDFTCIWSKEVNNSLDKDTGSKQGIERLFTINS